MLYSFQVSSNGSDDIPPQAGDQYLLAPMKTITAEDQYIIHTSPLSIEDDENVIASITPELFQNYPNPWFMSSSKGNPSTQIQYNLPQAADIRLTVITWPDNG